MTTIRPFTVSEAQPESPQATRKSASPAKGLLAQPAVQADVRPQLNPSEAENITQSLIRKSEEEGAEQLLAATGALDEDSVRRLLEE